MSTHVHFSLWQGEIKLAGLVDSAKKLAKIDYSQILHVLPLQLCKEMIILNFL